MQSNIDQLMHAWLDDPSVGRTPHDDDEINSTERLATARLRPTSPITIAAARVLQGAGYVSPVGDGSFLIKYTPPR